MPQASPKIKSETIENMSDTISELVKLNKEAGKQTKIMITLTIILAFLTAVLVIFNL